MSEELQYADDMVSLFVKYDHKDQLKKFVKETEFYYSTLEKILEFAIEKEDDELLNLICEKIFQCLHGPVDIHYLCIYALIFSKKIEILKVYFERLQNLKWEMYVLSYNIGFVEFFNEFFNDDYLNENAADFFQNHFQTYKYGTLPEVRSQCDQFFRNIEELKIFTQEKSINSVDETLAKILLKLKHDDEFKNNTIKSMVEVYHFVNENKEYFNL